MLRLLSQDSGARFAFLSHVPFFALPSLARTCRSWRSWIDTDSAMPKQQWCVALGRAPAFVSCPWTRRHISDLSLGRWGEMANPLPDRSDLYAVVEQASAFPHLRTLRVHIMPCIDDERVWDRCFTQLAAKLETFALTCPLFIHRCDATVAAAAKHLDKLANLSSLSISGHFEAADWIDLSALPKLPRLSHFTLTSGVLGFLVSPQQLAHLCNCKQLVTLEGGFARQGPQQEGEEWDDDLQARAIWEQRVIAFLESRFPADAPPLPAMTRLALPAITPAVWSRLTRFTSLQALEPYKWLVFGAEEWSKLSVFTSLRRVMLQPVRFGETLDGSLFAAPLSACATIESLDFGRVILSEKNLSLLTKGLPLLESLAFSMSILESLAPLVFAPALTTLSFHHCNRFDDHEKPLDVRRMLPALPALTDLSIHSGEAIPAEELATLTAALLARMPALQPEYLDQEPPSGEEQPESDFDVVAAQLLQPQH